MSLAASRGKLIHTVLPRMGSGSNTAHTVIFDYDQNTFYHSRGALEALEDEVSLAPGAIAFKPNFASWGLQATRYLSLQHGSLPITRTCKLLALW